MTELRIVFDGPPGPESGRFIEVENAQGASVNAGEWVERPNGWWELRIQQITPVSGYTAQSDAKVALVNEFKDDEERLLRKIDKMQILIMEPVDMQSGGMSIHPSSDYDHALISEARKSLMIGFMLLNRAVFQPQRITLPEDEPTVDEALERADLP